MERLVTRGNLNKLKDLKKRYSVKEICFKTAEKLTNPYSDYSARFLEFLPSETELEKQRGEGLEGPKISIIVPTYETQEDYLRQMIDSVCGQTYTNWELCLADGSQSDAVESVIKLLYNEETRISYHRLSKNKGISENTNAGFLMAEGDYIALLDHDDMLVESALYEVVKRIQDTGADMMYTDEDKMSSDGSSYMDPHFKRDFNRELLLGNNYICHFLVISRELLYKSGKFRREYDGAQDFDLVLRCSEKAERIEHIAKILYHWRIHPGSTAGNAQSKLYAYEAGRKAIKSYVRDKGWQGKVAMQKDLGFYRARYAVAPLTRIGVYFWGRRSRQFPAIWQQIQEELSACGCVVEIIDGNSEVFDYILVMNCNMTHYAIMGVPALIGSCSRDKIGVVGAKTYKKNKVVQCGYILESEQLLPQCAGLLAGFKGYFRRAVLASEVDAVTNQLAVVSKEAWKMGVDLEMKPEEFDGWINWCRSLKEADMYVIAEPQACAAVRDNR